MPFLEVMIPTEVVYFKVFNIGKNVPFPTNTLKKKDNDNLELTQFVLERL